MSTITSNTEQFINDVELLRKRGIVRYDSEIIAEIGIQKSNFSSIMNKRRNVSDKILKVFYAKYQGKLNDNKLSLSGNTIDKRKALQSKGTPVYELSATAGGIEYANQLPESPVFTVNVPGLYDCDFGMYVYGHSMYPVIETGSLILCRKINDKSVIMYGEIYLIRTSDYLMVKRLQKGENQKTILCTSDNFEKRAADFKRFEPFEINRDSIIDLYLVKGIIKKTQS